MGIFKDMDIQVFNPDTLLEDMLAASEGTIFMLGEKRIKNHEGDDTIQQTFARIYKATDSNRSITNAGTQDLSQATPGEAEE